MPGTAKVLGLNLTRNCFFFQTGNILFQIKISAKHLFTCLLLGYLSYLGFFSARIFLQFCFKGLIYAYIL